MPQTLEPIQHVHYYHIYNRGIDGETLFRENTNYEHFLRLYERYIDPVAETFAWCLLKNHFHLLVRIKDEEEIGDIPRKQPLPGHKATGRVCGQKTPPVVENPGGGWEKGKKFNPSNQFSHLFNSYTQAFNKRYNRHGSLFEKPFQRIQITHEKYSRNMVFYIHNNPVKHGFVEDMLEYPWSSYLSIISVKPTKLQRESVLGWFDSKNNFKIFHQKEHEEAEIKRFIID